MLRLGLLLAILACYASGSIEVPVDIAALLPSTSSPLLSLLENYEVVSVTSTYSAARQSVLTTSGQNNPDTFSLSFAFEEQQIDVDLSLHTNLFADGYKEERQVWRDGKRYPLEEPPATRPQLCHYQGKIHTSPITSSSNASLLSEKRSSQANTESTGIAAVSTCKELLPPQLQENTLLSRSGASFFSGSLILPDRILAVAPAVTLFDKPTLEKQLLKLSKRLQTMTSNSAKSATPAATVSAESLYVVYDVAQLAQEEGACGVDHSIAAFSQKSVNSTNAHVLNDTHTHAHTHTHTHSKKGSGVSATSTTTATPVAPAAAPYYIELFIANDKARFTTYGSNTESHTALLVNIVDAIYKSGGLTQETRVALKGQVTFSISDPWNLPAGTCTGCSAQEIDSSALLSAWADYAVAQGITADVEHLLSGRDFNGGVLGLAFVGTGCIQSMNNGVVQATNPSNTYVATILTHEIGHNLNALHDGVSNACAPSQYIMGTTMLNPPATTFSPCSISVIDSFVSSSVCFSNVPTGWTDVTPSCGDGIVQDGEQCDCGKVDCTGIDNCCNGSTCTLIAGAMCAAHNGCCDQNTCQAASQGTVCRASTGICDIAEVCDGSSIDCPANIFRGVGVPCSDEYGAGLCYKGMCASHKRQCSAGTIAYAGNPFAACDAEVQTANNYGNFCGTLFCATAPSTPDKCQAFPDGNKYLTVADGVPCGLESSTLQSLSKQCYLGTCVASSDLAFMMGTYVYSMSDWSPCYQCDEIQTRSGTCVEKASGAPVDSSLCGAAPATLRYCVNSLIGCTGQGQAAPANTGGGDGVYFFGVEYPQTWFIIVSSIAGAALLIITWVVGIAMTKGTDSTEAKEDLLAFMRRGFTRNDTYN